jgi:hypothetical protein
MTEDERTDDDGLGEQVRKLLEMLDALDADESAHASASTDVLGFDVDVDVDFGTLDDADAKTEEGSRRARRPRRARRRNGAESDRSTSERSASRPDYLVSLREREDGVTVSVDLGGESARPPTPSVENGDLVLHVAGHVAETVSLPFDHGVVAGRSVNNGVLVVDVNERPSARSDAGTDAGEGGEGS